MQFFLDPPKGFLGYSQAEKVDEKLMVTSDTETWMGMEMEMEKKMEMDLQMKMVAALATDRTRSPQIATFFGFKYIIIILSDLCFVVSAND